MFEVNVLGMMVLTQQVIIQMLENQRPGHVIDIASMAGRWLRRKAVYSAEICRFRFFQCLTLKLKPAKIQVTTVNPGPIQTEFFDKADPSGQYLANLGNHVLDPQKLARRIVRNMEHPVREINRPGYMEVAARFYTLFPAIGDFLAGGIFNKK